MNQQINNVDPITGQPAQYSVTPPQPASLVNPFSAQAQQVGSAVMGNVDQRQASLGNSAPIFQKSCGRGPKQVKVKTSTDAQFFKAPPSTPSELEGSNSGNTRILEEKKTLTRMSKNELRLQLFKNAMKDQNDSLRALPKTDINFLPTFDTSTAKGRQEQENFYTISPKNQKLKNLQQLDAKIKKKYGY